MNKRFNKVLSEQMDFFSNSAKTGIFDSMLLLISRPTFYENLFEPDKIHALKGDIEDVKQVALVTHSFDFIL